MIPIEREPLSEMIEALPEGVCILDANDRVLFLNRYGEEVLGWQQRDWLGQQVVPLLNVQDQGQEALSEVLKTEKTQRSHGVYFKKKDMSVCPVFCSIGRTSYGKIIFFHEISDQKKQEALQIQIQIEKEFYIAERTAELSHANFTLRQQIKERRKIEDDLRATTFRTLSLVENLPWAGLLEDETGKILYLNQKIYTVFNPDSKDAPDALARANGALFLENISPFVVSSDVFLKRTNQIMQNKVVSTSEEVLLKDGRVLERDYFPIFTQNQYRGHLWQYRDVTTQRKIQQQLQRSERLASVGSLAAGVAHEINNPLTYMSVNLGVGMELVNKLLDEKKYDLEALSEIKQILSEIAEGTERVKFIVRDLKSFSRVEEGVTELVDVRNVLDTVTKMTVNEVKHRAQLVKEYSDVPMIRGNPTRLGQVFMNLIVNAAQATPEGKSAENEIRITTQTRITGEVEIQIRDTGMGIPPENLKKIFDPFFTTKAVGQGTGLGLPICQNIITELGGDIFVESRVGKGTVFKVILPPASEQTTKVLKTSKDQENENLKEGSVNQKQVSRILIVDDEVVLGSAVGRILQKDYEVMVVDSGRKGLELVLGQNQFDVVLCDIMMPDVTGMDIHDTLGKQNPAMLDKFIFISGGAFTERTRAFIQTIPERQLISKPFEMSTIKNAIRTLLETTRPQEQNKVAA